MRLHFVYESYMYEYKQIAWPWGIVQLLYNIVVGDRHECGIAVGRSSHASQPRPISSPQLLPL